jgi:hypothetical protein
MSALLADLFELAGLSPEGRPGTTLPILWRRMESTRVPRLKFFIHVDAAALESCKNEGREMRFELDPTKYCCVNLMQCGRIPWARGVKKDEEYPKDPDDEEADVDWMVMSIGSLIPSIYLSFNDRASYYIRYKKAADSGQF